MLHANVLLPLKTNNIKKEHAISFFVRTSSILLVSFKFAIQCICHEAGNYLSVIYCGSGKQIAQLIVKHGSAATAHGLVTKTKIVNAVSCKLLREHVLFASVRSVT